jgi:ATP-dependent DNA helicase RecQ
VKLRKEISVAFSVHELKDAFEERTTNLNIKVSIDDVEMLLFVKIDAIKIEGDFWWYTMPYQLKGLKKILVEVQVEDYQLLNEHYENKVQQIHIVGEYARKMIDDYKDALQFVEDYFQLNNSLL